MGRIVMPGGTGFLGQSLAAHLTERGHQVVVLTRKPKPDARFPEVAWDGRTVGAWQAQVDGALAVINFTGKSVNCRYTPENRAEIVRSRVDSVKVLGEALRACKAPPKVLIQAGSLAIFGHSTEPEVFETSPVGTGFSPDVCKTWEATFDALDVPCRKVFFRISFALGRGGGALEPLEKLARNFMGGTVGDGTQGVSWIHLFDLNEMFRWAIERDDVVGLFHATGPTPTDNATLMRTLRKVLGRPWAPPTPAFAVKVGAALMGSEGELALTGRRGIPRRFQELGFAFKWTDLEACLRDLVL
jgi:hypothetical protein